jgi:hypothetical protein
MTSNDDDKLIEGKTKEMNKDHIFQESRSLKRMKLRPSSKPENENYACESNSFQIQIHSTSISISILSNSAFFTTHFKIGKGK